MPSKADRPTSGRALGAFVDNVLSVRTLVMVAAGVLAGSSIAVLGEEVIVLPLLGSLPGPAVGAVGLVVALAVYRQGGCCDDCGDEGCGCTGDCGDSCSYNPR